MPIHQFVRHHATNLVGILIIINEVSKVFRGGAQSEFVSPEKPLDSSSTSLALKTFTARSQGFSPPVMGIDGNQYTVNSCAATPKNHHYPDGIYYFKSYKDGTQEEVSLIKGSPLDRAIKCLEDGINWTIADNVKSERDFKRLKKEARIFVKELRVIIESRLPELDDKQRDQLLHVVLPSLRYDFSNQKNYKFSHGDGHIRISPSTAKYSPMVGFDTSHTYTTRHLKQGAHNLVNLIFSEITGSSLGFQVTGVTKPGRIKR